MPEARYTSTMPSERDSAGRTAQRPDGELEDRRILPGASSMTGNLAQDALNKNAAIAGITAPTLPAASAAFEVAAPAPVATVRRAKPKVERRPAAARRSPQLRGRDSRRGSDGHATRRTAGGRQRHPQTPAKKKRAAPTEGNTPRPRRESMVCRVTTPNTYSPRGSTA